MTSLVKSLLDNVRQRSYEAVTHPTRLKGAKARPTWMPVTMGHVVLCFDQAPVETYGKGPK